MYRLALLATLAVTLLACDPVVDDDLETCDANCSGQGRVVSVEFFGGLCATGPCSTTLDLSTAEQATLSWSTIDGTNIVDHTATAALTTAGITTLANAEADIGDTTFDESYGCPGCDDGGAIALSLWGSVTRDLQRTQWEAGAPPQVAESLENLAFALQTQLKDCAGDAIAYTEDCTQDATTRE